jgi:hypothetical protein
VGEKEDAVRQPFGQARCLFLIAVAAFWIAGNPGPISAASPTCYDVCGETTSCTEVCNPGDGSSTTCGEFNGGSSAGWCVGYCGDGYCNGSNGENEESCSSDCHPFCSWNETSRHNTGSYYKWHWYWGPYAEVWYDQTIVEQNSCTNEIRGRCDTYLYAQCYFLSQESCCLAYGYGGYCWNPDTTCP